MEGRSKEAARAHGNALGTRAAEEIPSPNSFIGWPLDDILGAFDSIARASLRHPQQLFAFHAALAGELLGILSGRPERTRFPDDRRFREAERPENAGAMRRPAPASPATFDEVATMAIDGQTLRYARSSGRGDGPPLLLCNGIGANLELLAPLAAALAGRAIVTFDAPGVGGSPAPVFPYRLRYVASLADGLMRRLGHRGPIDVLGVSWGGALAQQFAYDHPDRCRKLILAATSCGMFMVPGRFSVFRKLASPRRYHDPSYLRRIAPEIYGGRLRHDAALIDGHLEHIEAAPGHGYLYQLAALWGWSSLPWLPRLRQPTLVLAGSEDPVVPMVNARILARLIPQARLETMADGHLFIVTSAPAVAQSVASFLAEGDALQGGRAGSSIVTRRKRNGAGQTSMSA